MMMNTIASLVLLLTATALAVETPATPMIDERRAEAERGGIVGFAPVGQQSGGWEGTYAFGEDGGETAGGTPIFVHHQIKIYRTAHALLADIESNGYQNARQLVCDVRIRGRRANLYFKRYGETNMFKPYRKGQLMLALERTPGKLKPVIVTHWGAYGPSLQPLKSGRIYFTPVDRKLN